jgi:exopolyphosphatase/guanosine-5'-triphosphate,3'-diphosphate pyrophosphatase
VVRDRAADPVVIRNDPLLDDGTPMPTRYWLVGRAERRAVDRLEAAGGIRRAEREVDGDELRHAHERYAAERDAALPASWTGPRPAGGVGGTREGVKCLHAHYAWYLAGGDDPVGRWVAQQLSAQPAQAMIQPAQAMIQPAQAMIQPAQATTQPAQGPPAAAIDCGTNSTRLLVAYPRGATLERRNTITRLGQGVDHSRVLAPEAIERTLAALREYRKLIDEHGVDRIRMTATSAARDAVNRDAFFLPAEQIVGVLPELLGGDEEGRLSFVGATLDLDPAGAPWLVVDIGGGSTELVWGPGPGGVPAAVSSLDVGCVRLTERFLVSDPPTVSEMNDARAFVGSLLDEALEAKPVLAEPAALVGLAGTVSCLAGVDLGLDEYDFYRLHHHVLSRSRAEEILSELASFDSRRRRDVPGVEPLRADVIVGGAIVLSEIMHRLDFDECLTSESDILDGLVASTAAA